MAETNERDAKLAQWLNEAHVKEAELEADLTAHISLTRKPAYKKRLQQHLRETREHKRRVASRIKALGAKVDSPSIAPIPGGEIAGKAVAAVKGQVGAARATVTPEAETHLRNAQEELREEHVEIAIYTRIETLAEAVGDRETRQLVRAIRRDEERMARYLESELKRLVKDVVSSEIPRSQRATKRRRASASSGRRTAARSRPKAGSAAGSPRRRTARTAKARPATARAGRS